MLCHVFWSQVEYKIVCFIIDENVDAFDSDCEEIINSISEKCEVCKHFKRTPCHPVVCLPLATKSNQVVAKDLKQFRPRIYLLHFIGLFTRYSLAKVIRRKLPEVIINGVAMVWLASGFGPPEKFLIDYRGEFANENYKELMEQFTIEICGTSTNSPWHVKEITILLMYV